jgi:hypothetical protein
LRGAAFHKDNKLRFGFSKLVEISENPENIRVRYNISRSVSQASASCDGNVYPILDEQHQNQNPIKSLEKFKP